MFWIKFLLFLATPVVAQTPQPYEAIPNPRSYEDFEHPNRGCPENSECDQVMGLQLTRWMELLTKLKDPKIPPTSRAQQLETFRARFGIPVEFYTSIKAQQGFKPLYYNSPCKNHNPKAPEERILIGKAFLKSLSHKTGVIWRDQTTIEVPVGELLSPQTVEVYRPEATLSYALPLNDQPLFIKDKNLYILKEYEDLFFTLKISPEGKWSIENLDFTQLSQWDSKRENVACPESKKKASNVFEADFCKKIWDEDLKQTVIVRMQMGCPI